MIKGLHLDGPMLLQISEDLPFLAQPMTVAERSAVKALGQKYGQTDIEDNAPVTFIGSGATLNDATKNGLDSAARVTGLFLDLRLAEHDLGVKGCLG